MANLLYGGQTDKAGSFGSQWLGMGLESAFKKQQMDLAQKEADFDKKKFEFLKLIQTAEMKQKETLFNQQQTELKKKEAYLTKMGQLLEGLFDEEGGVNIDVARKAMALQAANTGKVSNELVKLLTPKEEKPIVVGPGSSIYKEGEFTQAPDRPSTTEATTKKEHESRVKRHYDAKMSDWNKYAADQWKQGNDPGQPDTVRFRKEAEALAAQEERWELEGKPPVRPKAGVSFSQEGALREPRTGTAVKGTSQLPGPWLEDPLRNLSAPFRINPLSQEGALGWFGKKLGIGPDYNFGGRPATPTQPAALPLMAPQAAAPQPPGPADIGETLYVQMRAGLGSEEELRNEYRALKKAQGK